MKKLFVMLMVTVFCVSVTNVSAMTKSELKNKLTAPYSVNGGTVQVTNAQAVLIEEYLQQNNVLGDDADYIARAVDRAVAVMRAGTASSLSELTPAEKNSIIKIIEDVSNNTAVKVKISKGNVLTIYNLDGSVFATVTDVIKYTDSNKLAVLSAATLAGIVM